MTIQKASHGDIELAYETFGSPDDPTLVLVMGLATQMIGWHDDFCALIADNGFHVVRFDNRDIGLSTHLDDAGTPDLSPLFSGQPITGRAVHPRRTWPTTPRALLDALGLDRVHLVGASMGGMIAQEFALRHPGRLLSLTSIMSTPAPQIGPPTPAGRGGAVHAAADERGGGRRAQRRRSIG